MEPADYLCKPFLYFMSYKKPLTITPLTPMKFPIIDFFLLRSIDDTLDHTLPILVLSNLCGLKRLFGIFKLESLSDQRFQVDQSPLNE